MYYAMEGDPVHSYVGSASALLEVDSLMKHKTLFEIKMGRRMNGVVTISYNTEYFRNEERCKEEVIVINQALGL